MIANKMALNGSTEFMALDSSAKSRGVIVLIVYTVKPVLSGHSKKTKILMTNGSLMKVKSIAECSHWSLLQYF